jgi:hypothetical protein
MHIIKTVSVCECRQNVVTKGLTSNHEQYVMIRVQQQKMIHIMIVVSVYEIHWNVETKDTMERMRLGKHVMTRIQEQKMTHIM